MTMAELENFSAGYALVRDATVQTWAEEEAHMDVDLYDELTYHLGEPIIGFVGGLHYQFRPSKQVLTDQCAVPRRNRGRRVGGSALLVRR
ncbi:hypothetical protein HCTV-8_gp3 [Haloarcula virus HCTV-8]|uniref:Uncharacterized protein n=3 Tax=Haloferacalesvirus hv5 TaxID=1273753 RepID=A0AAE9BVP0_9CAUD|nr:hypothetical protein HCTV-7_gp3 [Haloarcula phage HCTV-7]UBF20444.1 hypothetical protein HCTV-9_gp3 [Haloarcula phage HCTV-9]UBF20560.1 hypothetical protein HCTV-11_gp3 [Haloarcula phage HCTV-11]UBF20902.1 hypothetical protein HCTV-8_gp3 [Haloarcula virus HCTV-8]UBF21014.1 hypothetical protein HCTV-10_gp3 [Haloarcula virus HCTV-10]